MIDVKDSLVFKSALLLQREAKSFLITLGMIGKDFVKVMYYILRLRVNLMALIEQSSRFAVDSLPITLAIVGMTSIIISMQISPELAKQGAENYIGMLSALVMVRELAAIMAGFAIISMIGSSFASELASMSVSEQIDAMRVLRVDPVEYLIVPRFLAGVIMMPFVFVLSSFVGLLCAGYVAKNNSRFKHAELCRFSLAGPLCKRYYDCSFKIFVFWGYDSTYQLFIRFWCQRWCKRGG